MPAAALDLGVWGAILAPQRGSGLAQQNAMGFTAAMFILHMLTYKKNVIHAKLQLQLAQQNTIGITATMFILQMLR